jgi:parallel beta-helix repeat protein
LKRITHLFGFSRSNTLRDDAMRRKAARRRQPTLDLLEGRVVLSSGPSAAAAPTSLTLAVTSSADNPSNPAPGTLRWALLDADNQQPGTTVTIELEVPEIRPVAGLPEVTFPVTIDGTAWQSEHGAPVVLDGSEELGEGDGLSIEAGASGSVIKGLAFGNFTEDYGLNVFNASNVQILDDYIGVEFVQNSAGQYVEKAAPNANGLNLSCDTNIVVSGCQVSGNSLDGIDLLCSSDVTIQYSLVGANLYGNADTDSFGAPLGNGAAYHNGSGINVFNSNDCTITGNVIVGNGLYGVLVTAGSTGNTLSNNSIGVDGLSILPNFTGVLITGASSYNTLSGNVIGGNSWDGVEIDGYGSNGNALLSNWIGVNPNYDGYGDPAVPNWNGVQLVDGSAQSVLYQNVIAGNYSDGVFLEQTTYNYLDQNWVGIASNGVAFGNGELGIILVDGASYNYLYANNIQWNGAGGLATFSTGVYNTYSYNYAANNGGGGDYIWD